MNTNVNSPLFDQIPEHARPDVILVRKVHQRRHNDDGASTVATSAVDGITHDLDNMELE